jgi:hypothetical protein
MHQQRDNGRIVCAVRWLISIIKVKGNGVYGPNVFRFGGKGRAPKVLPATFSRPRAITKSEYEAFRAARRKRGAQ